MLTKTTTSAKYSGADWLNRTLNYKKVERPLSDFGVKVANILGQVYQGIYHIQASVLSKKVDWGNENVIAVSPYGQLATFDANHLTLLLLCCEQAGVGLHIRGSFKGFTKIVFLNDGLKPLAGISKYPAVIERFVSFESFAKGSSVTKKLLYQGFEASGEKETLAGYSIEHLHHYQLQNLIYGCHKHCIRASVQGRSPQSLELMLSHRKRNGSVFERHPTLEDVQREYEAVIEIDYMELEKA